MRRTDPILITGSHRSGTTWIGSTLAQCTQRSHYVYEPFNPMSPPGITKPRIRSLYEYVDGGKFPEIEEAILNLGAGYFPAFGGGKIPLKDRISLVKKAIGIALSKPARKRPIIKSSEALLYTSFFTRNLDAHAVITVRHPAAFIVSCERMKWDFNLGHLTAQHEFSEKHLKSVKHFGSCEIPGIPERIVNNTWLWYALHSYIANLEKDIAASNRVHIIRHEDFCENPSDCFFDLFEKLGLTPKIDALEFINRQTEGEVGRTTSSDQHVLVRNSKKIPKAWQEILSSDTQDWIRNATEPVWREFYGTESWDT